MGISFLLSFLTTWSMPVLGSTELPSQWMEVILYQGVNQQPEREAHHLTENDYLTTLLVSGLYDVV
jgi:hypothetical protein